MKKGNGDPDNLGGLGDMLPADVLTMLNEALERLHRAGHINQCSKIEFVYVAPGGQHVETIQSQNIYTYKRQSASEETTSVIPPPEVMARAVELTMVQGYWWASTAWAVVYRVYQMKGYLGGIRQFVREVEEWPWQKKPIFPCNYDSVQKPIVGGKLMRTIDKWKDDGAMEQMQKLGQALFDLLN